MRGRESTSNKKITSTQSPRRRIKVASRKNEKGERKWAVLGVSNKK